MAMSKDRIKFFLPVKYLRARGKTMYEVLERAFGISYCETDELIRAAHAGSDNSPHHRHLGYSTGFWVTCRPSQFGRFVVLRYEALAKHQGAPTLCNGVRDLTPKIIHPTPPPPPKAEVDVGDRHNKC